MIDQVEAKELLGKKGVRRRQSRSDFLIALILFFSYTNVLVNAINYKYSFAG